MIGNNSQRANEFRWIQAPKQVNLSVPFIKATALRPIGDNKVQYQAVTQRGIIKLQVLNISAYPMSNGDCFDDMCEMDILNEPEVLNNLVQRYKADKIFTYIGPTLIVINPYCLLPQYFSNDAMLRIRQKILNNTSNQQPPHVYLMAGKAYTSMIGQKKKQAIVISGESGAGKTQSTKYCLQLLTSLSHKDRHPIQAKILSCNPILQAFGNSKTIRNDNSSRFGKYMQVYFEQDNTIAGATIYSYLLQKSRIVSVAQNERSFHIFYALIASKQTGLQNAASYKYLNKSKCYEATGIDDEAYFRQIKDSMKNIGFLDTEQNKIWQLLSSILELGNVQFDDNQHLQNESKPCKIKNKQLMEKVAKRLGVIQQNLQKILLFEKKNFLKQITLSPYNKFACHGNINTLSKAIYNAIFEFILYKIQISLKPKSNKKFNSISILDIFGFENFENNSFEQFCINFTNEKLLKLYNMYVFQREMILLKEDGLGQQIKNINPPANDDIIEAISGKLSLFSIINDLTMPKQFTDKDIIQGFENKLGKSPILKFEKLTKTKFTVIHSQCSVKYQIQGFKQKNQDKILEDIATLVNNLFENKNKQQKGKTLLNKFQKQIQDLISQLSSSSVHFIRCIKPNEKKIPHCAQQQYILTQIRYLGVFETIQIRKKTFPSRWLYKQFLQRFEMIFPGLVGNQVSKTQKILKSLKGQTKGYLLGNLRVYMNSDLEQRLSLKLHQFMKKRVQSGKIIWSQYKRYKFRKNLRKNLTLLIKRIRIWKAFAKKQTIKIYEETFNIFKTCLQNKRAEQRQIKAKKLNQMKTMRQKQEQKQKAMKKIQNSANIQKYLNSLLQISDRYMKRKLFTKLKTFQKKNLQQQKVKKNLPKIQTTALNSSFLNESIIEETDEVYKRNVSKEEKQKQFEFNESFLNQKSVDYSKRPDILFQGYLPVGFFKNNEKKQQLEKLRSIFSEKYKCQVSESQEDFFSPPSDDGKFKIQDTPHDFMNKIISFNSKDFFKTILRKRTNFIGMKKDQDDILVAKLKPLSKSLTLMTPQDEIPALKVFKILLRISDEAKLDNVFKLIEEMINACQNTSPEVKNQIYLQLIKQSNTDSELSSVRIIQSLAVFLHIYTPDNDFLLSGLNFYFKKAAGNQFSEKQHEYISYIFKKIMRKIERPNSINYMPIKFQMMALMCKRKISVPVYLSVGNSILIRVESYETFSDIKIKVMEQFGINHKRLKKQYFTFYEIINFENQQLEESPILENQIVWDTITYWEKAKDKYKETGMKPPGFFLMFKIRYIYQCYFEDEQTVELMFHQCYFDYFIGRIRMDISNMGALAACVKLLKFSHNPKNDITGTYPVWVFKAHQEQLLIEYMTSNIDAIKSEDLSDYQIKYKFLTICEECPLSLSLVIQTEQNMKIFLKPKKIYLVEKNEIIEEIPIKKITKYAQDDEKFVFELRGSSQTKIVYTQYGSICCSYLSLLPKLISNINSHHEKQQK